MNENSDHWECKTPSDDCNVSESHGVSAYAHCESIRCGCDDCDDYDDCGGCDGYNGYDGCMNDFNDGDCETESDDHCANDAMSDHHGDLEHFS